VSDISLPVEVKRQSRHTFESTTSSRRPTLASTPIRNPTNLLERAHDEPDLSIIARKLKSFLSRGLVRGAIRTDAMILTSGLNDTSTRIIGEAFAARKAG
jgi:hypothetical protein